MNVYSEPIDDVDYAILKVVHDADEPLWKKRVHSLVSERTEELPLMNTVAVNTVGRRIDQLQNNGMLDNVIVQPDQIDRDLVIAYILTDKGRAAMTEKRRAYLRDIVRQDIFKDFRNEDVAIRPLLSAMQDEFDMQRSSIDRLDDRFNSVQLAAILALYYIEIESEELLTQQVRRLVREVARGEKTPDEAVEELD